MIFISAGHFWGDSGAISGQWQENKLTIELRNLITAHLDTLGAKYKKDSDNENLRQYINRIKVGSGSVVCEVHFNAGVATANGVECLVKDGAGNSETRLANDVCNAISAHGIKNRGVKSESKSHRGHLGILHTGAGISVLPEICFISNEKDMEMYQASKTHIARDIAELLVRYDELYS